MRRGFLGIGSNVGDRGAHVRAAIERLNAAGIEVTACSSAWDTEPLDGAGPGRFVNGVIEVRFALAPEALLDRLHAIEQAGGRVRSAPNAPREIDLDILWIDGVRCRSARLEVPHPRMWGRAFVLAPLAELAADLRDPDSGRTVAEALRSASGRVRRLGPLTGAARPRPSIDRSRSTSTV